MIETILLAIIICKLKKYEIKPLFKSWALYPVIFLELIYLVFQINIFMGNYEILDKAYIFKNIYFLSYLFLVLKNEIYISAIVGSVFMVLGGWLNDLAIKANGGFMPVFPTLSYLTGYAKEGAFGLANDIHILGSSDTNLKILTDFIDIGYSILSIGDIFIRIFVFLIIYNSIKTLNNKAQIGGKTC